MIGTKCHVRTCFCPLRAAATAPTRSLCRCCIPPRHLRAIAQLRVASPCMHCRAPHCWELHATEIRATGKLLSIELHASDLHAPSSSSTCQQPPFVQAEGHVVLKSLCFKCFMCFRAYVAGASGACVQDVAITIWICFNSDLGMFH